MFSAIARRYDLLNHVLSLNVDRRWRRALVDMAGASEGAAVLDVATGTGDVALEFARRSRAAAIVGLDRSAGMLVVGQKKLAQKRLAGRVRLLEGDALELPFAAGTFDVVTIAFGLRNLPDIPAGIEEMARVLRPGGHLLILEFFPPRRAMLLNPYRFYLGSVLPTVGRLVSGSKEAYRYLASSIKSFVSHEKIVRHLKDGGFADVTRRDLTAGIVSIYRAAKV